MSIVLVKGKAGSVGLKVVDLFIEKGLEQIA